jgi:hypothetical protein
MFSKLSLNAILVVTALASVASTIAPAAQSADTNVSRPASHPYLGRWEPVENSSSGNVRPPTLEFLRNYTMTMDGQGFYPYKLFTYWIYWTEPSPDPRFKTVDRGCRPSINEHITCSLLKFGAVEYQRAPAEGSRARAR